MPDSGNSVIHRVGGASVANLRLKQQETQLNPPGISVLIADSAAEAAQQMRTAFPKARMLHDAAKTIGSATVRSIRSAGFDVIHVPTKALPNHHRLIHSAGVAGFSDQNLALLASAFTNSTGN